MDRQHLQPRRGKPSAEQLLGDHASRLVQTSVSALPEAIAAFLGAVAGRLSAERATLWELHPGERRVSLLQQWAAPGCAQTVTDVSADALPWLMRAMVEGRRVAFRACATLPREAARERRWSARYGPRSAAFLPLVVGEVTAGVLGVGTLRRERSWGSATLAFLERAGVVLANAMVRMKAHEASLGAEGRLAGILEAGPDGVLLVRPSGRIDLANGRASAILRRTRQDLCSARLQDVLGAAAEAPRRPGLGRLDALLTAGEPLRLQARCGDGSTLPVEVMLREVRTAGEALFCCGIRDVSEDRRAREEAIRIRDEIALRGRTAMLAEMGSGIAHELNQPLTAILSNAETAQRLLRSSGADAAPLREALQDVVNETRRAADILGRMREMLRRRPFEGAPVDVGELLGNVAGRFREEAVVRSVRLALEVAPGLPPVLGDRIQLEQVVMNLVLNAFEAIAAGNASQRAVTIRARATAAGVDVSVRDSGPGLTDEAMARAFEAFFTTKPRGLGVGLPISRAIVEAHGGRLLARNNADRGATFQFDLPAAPLAGATGEGGKLA